MSCSRYLFIVHILVLCDFKAKIYPFKTPQLFPFFFNAAAPISTRFPIFHGKQTYFLCRVKIAIYLEGPVVAVLLLTVVHARAGMDPEVQSLVNDNAPYLRVLDNGKIECTLNGHAFAPKKDVIEAFLK